MGEESAEPQGQESESVESTASELLTAANDHNERAHDLSREAASQFSSLLEEHLTITPSVGYAEGELRIKYEFLLEDAIQALNEAVGPEFEATEGSDGSVFLTHNSEPTATEEAQQVKRIIGELQEEHDREPGAPETKVITRAQAAGITEQEAVDQIQQLRDAGKIYSPDQDHLRLV